MTNDSEKIHTEKISPIIGKKIGEGRENKVYEYGEDKVIKFPKLEMINSSEYLEDMRKIYLVLKIILGAHLPDLDFQRIRRFGKNYNGFIQRKVSGKSIAEIFKETNPDKDCVAEFLADKNRREQFAQFFKKIQLTSLRIGIPLDMGQDNIFLEESGNIALIDIGGIPIIQEITQSQEKKYPKIRKVVAQSILKTLEEFQKWEHGLEAYFNTAELNKEYGIDEKELEEFKEIMMRKAMDIIEE